MPGADQGGGFTSGGLAGEVHRRAREDALRAMSDARRAQTVRSNAAPPHRTVASPVGPWGIPPEPTDPDHAAVRRQAADAMDHARLAMAGAHDAIPTGLGPVVDIYLSAGPNEGYGPSDIKGSTRWNPNDYYSCNRDEVRNCEIWRIRLRLGMDEPREVERVVAATGRGASRMGASMPALSPDGRYLAFRRQNYSDVNAASLGLGADALTTLSAFDLSRRRETIVKQSSSRTVGLRFPAWYDAGRLLYTAGTNPDGPGGGTLWSTDFNASTGLGEESVPLLGPDGAHSDTAFDDADVLRRAGGGGSPSNPNLRVASFGESGKANDTGCGGQTDGVPRVHTLPKRGGAARFECFSLGENRTTNDVVSCQHPAWSLDGLSIHCWQKDPGDRDSLDTSSNRSTLQLMYEYRQGTAGGEWTQSDARTAFVELTPAQLQDAFPRIYPAKGSPRPLGGPVCNFTAYKHGVECGSANFMVVTLFCSDVDYNSYGPASDVFSSRVMLIRKEPVAYWDLTAMVEAFNGVGRGSWHGIYATCGAPEGEE